MTSVSPGQLQCSEAYADNALFLYPDLMRHCRIRDGSYVLIEDLENSQQKAYCVAHGYSHMKSCLSVALARESAVAKLLAKRDTCLLRVSLALESTQLQWASVRIEKRFIDPFHYLSTCNSLRKKLYSKVIHPDDTLLTIAVNDTEWQLHIEDVRPGKGPIEADLARLSLAGEKSPVPNTVYVVREDTQITFTSQPLILGGSSGARFAGYSGQTRLLRKLILESDRAEAGLCLPRTILLTGPSGCGKTLAVSDIFERARGRVNLFQLNSSALLSKSLEFDKLRTAFLNLTQVAPSVLFVDNLEDISNEKSGGERRVVSWLKVLLDGLPRDRRVVLLAATNRPELMDPSLRRPGRFDIEIDFPIPSPQDRRLILEETVRGSQCSLSEAEKEDVAERTHGFTGADIRHLCEMALLHSGPPLSHAALSETLYRTKPSVMREISLEKPNVSWADIGGMHDLRHLLEECVVWPIRHPDSFLRLGIDPPKGVLMYGPPGCCKTMVGRALASESGLNFFSIKGPELFSKWVGESERAIREIFRKARAAAPSILFFDEIDALASERGQSQSAVGDRVLAQLLTEMDGVERLSRVVIIAATNRPDIVDKALLRPGRLDSVVYVPLPDLATRREIFRIRTARMPLPAHQRDSMPDQLARLSEGYTGAEVTAVCQRAGLIALSQCQSASEVSEEHFREALRRVSPRTSPDTVHFYEKFAAS